MQQHNIAILDIAEIGQALFERLRKGSADLGGPRPHIAYSPNLAGLASCG